MEAYKASIKESLKKEEDTLKAAKKDTKVTNFEFLRKRIQKRIDMINAELTEEVEEQAPEQVEPEVKKVETVEEKVKLKEEIKEGIKTSEIILKEQKHQETVEIAINKEGKLVKKPTNVIQESQVSQLEKLIHERLDDYKEANKYFKKVS